MLEPMTRSRLILLAVVVAAGAQLGCDDDDDLVGPGLPVSVYTRNLYLGSDLTPLIGAGSPEAIPAEAAKIWANIQASDFPERAKVLAADIVDAAPDLVALQEVSLYRQQVPSDISPGNTAPNAEEVVLDFLALLMTEIDARGGGYRVVGEAINADAELPVAADDQGGVYDLRLTDRDVILARDTAQTGYFNVDHFATAFEFPVGGAQGVLLKTIRSVSWVDADVGGARFTFANTHLEIQSLEIPTQIGQAVEMMNTLQGVGGPMLLLGDFNSDPGEASYLLTETRFDDVWPEARGADPGFTCCQAGDLMNPDSAAANRIDLVWHLGRFRVNQAEVRGSDPATGRTPSGLWASDHFGVSAHVELVP
jgi:endonuclease/exonuclease/phosphatase family metal-dependent hydrolase